MRSSIMVATIAAMAVSASGTVIPLHKRQVGGVLICTGVNAIGPCTYQVYSLNECHQLSAPYLENTNTFAPDGEDFICFPRLYDCGGICRSPTGCTFGKVDFAYEHKYNLSAIGWDKLFRSFDCTVPRYSVKG